MSFTIPYDDFGGRGPVLHFSAPNAYTPRSFSQFLLPFTEHFHVLSAHHRPLWYLTPNYGPADKPEEYIDRDWDAMGEDLLRFLDQQKLDQVIGMGHSLGAVATMMAARHEPERFQALILLEPVFLPPAILEHLAARPELAEERPIVHSAKRRRHQWSNRQEAFDRFRSKSVFDRWSDEALWDYVNEGLRDDPAANGVGPVTLAFPRDWEARFYARAPLNVWEEIPLLMPKTLAVRGTETDTLFPDAWALWQNLQPQATFVEMDNVGHMLTAEAPQDTAAITLHWLQDQGLLP